ncbi:MAG: hypothetical protein LUQ09_03780 [Methanomassiliicoccales archaeon]|nr:hypothetical protein [Methanomassiliicoccales archaeon]
MRNENIAQATLNFGGEVLEPRLDIRGRVGMALPYDIHTEKSAGSRSLFGEWRGATVLCACGSLVRLDQSAVNRRRQMGKPVECRHCRNRRVAMEHADLDNEYNDREGD